MYDTLVLPQKASDFISRKESSPVWDLTIAWLNPFHFLFFWPIFTIKDLIKNFLILCIQNFKYYQTHVLYRDLFEIKIFQNCKTQK